MPEVPNWYLSEWGLRAQIGSSVSEVLGPKLDPLWVRLDVPIGTSVSRAQSTNRHICNVRLGVPNWHLCEGGSRYQEASIKWGFEVTIGTSVSRAWGPDRNLSMVRLEVRNWHHCKWGFRSQINISVSGAWDPDKNPESISRLELPNWHLCEQGLMYQYAPL